MSQILFVLGAGASVDAGVPVMDNFFERANEIHARYPALAPDAFQLVAKARANLQRAQSKAQFDLRNLESVFGAFEMAELLVEDSFGSLTTDEVHGLGRAMRRVIVATIERSMKLSFSNCALQAPRNFGNFGALVLGLIERGHEVAIATFNYDVGIELGLACAGVRADYWLKGFAGPEYDRSQKAVPVLKFHGSLNWARCTNCGEILVQRVEDAIRDKDTEIRQYVSRPNESIDTYLEMGTALANLQCLADACDGAKCSADPVMIPPTAYKVDSHRQLQGVWRTAASRLQKADAVFVMGYSWPLSDHFFHNLFAVGSVGDTLLSRFWVCNPDLSVQKRFRDKLLGQQALDCFGPPETKDAHYFRRAIDAVAELYGIDSNRPQMIVIGRPH